MDLLGASTAMTDQGMAYGRGESIVNRYMGHFESASTVIDTR